MCHRGSYAIVLYAEEEYISVTHVPQSLVCHRGSCARENHVPQRIICHRGLQETEAHVPHRLIFHNVCVIKHIFLRGFRATGIWSTEAHVFQRFVCHRYLCHRGCASQRCVLKDVWATEIHMPQSSVCKDLILMYRNSGEWRLGNRKEKWFVCAQISVPSAALQKQFPDCTFSCSWNTEDPCNNTFYPINLLIDFFFF